MKRLLLLLGLAWVSACGSTRLTQELQQLRERLVASERATREQSRRIDDLENRLLLVAEGMERRENEAARRDPLPPLPVVTLHPPRTTATTETAVVGAARGTGGEAKGPDRSGATVETSANRRPVLRLEGTVPSAPSPEFSGEMQLPNLGVIKLPPRPALGAAGGGGDREAAANVEELYRRGRAALTVGQHAQAEGLFRELVTRFPSHELADNAEYWVGESHYARHDLAAASAAFREVLRRWPQGNKAPDAQLKLALCQLALGRQTEARKSLMAVIERYPRSEAAQAAEHRLQTLSRIEDRR